MEWRLSTLENAPYIDKSPAQISDYDEARFINMDNYIPSFETISPKDIRGGKEVSRSCQDLC